MTIIAKKNPTKTKNKTKQKIADISYVLLQEMTLQKPIFTSQQYLCAPVQLHQMLLYLNNCLLSPSLAK